MRTETSEDWAKVYASGFYDDLKSGKYRIVLNLLFDQKISIGKAAEAMAEIEAGFEPRLPEWAEQD